MANLPYLLRTRQVTGWIGDSDHSHLTHSPKQGHTSRASHISGLRNQQSHTPHPQPHITLRLRHWLRVLLSPPFGSYNMQAPLLIHRTGEGSEIPVAGCSTPVRSAEGLTTTPRSASPPSEVQPLHVLGLPGFLSRAPVTSNSGANTCGLVVWWPLNLGFSHLDLSSQKCSKDDPLGEDALRGMVINLRFPGDPPVGGRAGWVLYGPEVWNWDVCERKLWETRIW